MSSFRIKSVTLTPDIDATGVTQYTGVVEIDRGGRFYPSSVSARVDVSFRDDRLPPVLKDLLDITLDRVQKAFDQEGAE